MNEGDSPSTVILLGAGASSEYGFPLGPQLLTQLQAKVAPGSDYRELISRVLQASNSMRRSGDPETDMDALYEALGSGTVSTIDEFLANRDALAPVGKAAIALVLLELEDRRMFEDQSPDRDHLYKALWRLIYPSLSEHRRGIGSPDVAVLTLNYDRSFETFLLNAAIVSFGPDLDVAKDFIEPLHLQHLHGDLGSLDELDYGALHRENAEQSLVNAVRRIVLIGDTPNYTTAQKVLSKASRVFFLGFGYDTRILDGLFPQESSYGQIDIALGGSALNVPPERLKALTDFLADGRIAPPHQGRLSPEFINSECLEALYKLTAGNLAV